MDIPPSTVKSLPRRLWEVGCSLKLAIILASLATLLIMGGSLVMHFNPAIFGGMDRETMGVWLPWAWRESPHLAWWVPLSGLCLVLLGINTLCCLIDWLGSLARRWRKAGEYLIHTGFILLVAAYIWGNLAGYRSGPHQLFPGERLDIPEMPGYVLQLDDFTPQFSPQGQPLDMVNRVSLWHEERRIAQAEVRINHPLLYDGLVILPTSLGQALAGFRFHLAGRGFVDLTAGSRITLDNGVTLTVETLLADARQSTSGGAIPVSDRLGNPAILVALQSPAGLSWQGWYFLRGRLPAEMVESGVILQPKEPILRTYSLLTVNRDPADKLALAGSLCLSIGVVFAFFSFYRKRARGDRPEI